MPWSSPSFLRSVRYDRPPDGGLGYVVVLGAFMTYTVSVGLQYVQGVLNSAFLADAALVGGTSRATVAFAASIQSFAFLLGGLPAGWLVNSIGPRATAVVGAALIVFGFLVAQSSVVTTLPGVFFFYGLVTGMGCALSSQPAIVVIQKWFVTKRATATGLAVAGSGVGAIILGPLLQAQVDAGGWRQAFRAAAMIAAVILPLSALLIISIEVNASTPTPASMGSSHNTSRGDGMMEELILEPTADAEWGATMPYYWHIPPPPSGSGGGGGGGGGGGVATDAVNVSTNSMGSDAPSLPPSSSSATSSASSLPRLSAMQLLKQKRDFRLWLCFIGCLGCAWFVVIAHANVAFREAGTSPDAAALLVSVQGASNMAGRVILGFAADILASRLSKLAIVQVSIAGLGFATLGLAIPALMASYTYQCFFMLCNGLLGGSIVSLYAPISVDLVGLKSLPVAAGLFQAVQSPFVLFGPPLAGALRAAEGTWRVVWALIGAEILLALCFLSYVRVEQEGQGVLTVADCVRPLARLLRMQQKDGGKSTSGMTRTSSTTSFTSSESAVDARE